MSARSRRWSSRSGASFSCIATGYSAPSRTPRISSRETLLAAWRGLNGFEERASLRSWLYRIATNRSLNAIRERGRRPATENTMRPSRTRLAVEPSSGLEPYADSALPDPAPGP